MTDRDALRDALAEVQHYSLTVEPDDSAYMELDRDGRYVLIEDVDAVVAALAGSEPAGLDIDRLEQAVAQTDVRWAIPKDVRREAAELIAAKYAALAATPTEPPTYEVFRDVDGHNSIRIAGSEPAGLREALKTYLNDRFGYRGPDDGSHPDDFEDDANAILALLAATPTASPTAGGLDVERLLDEAWEFNEGAHHGQFYGGWKHAIKHIRAALQGEATDD